MRTVAVWVKAFPAIDKHVYRPQLQQCKQHLLSAIEGSERSNADCISCKAIRFGGSWQIPLAVHLVRWRCSNDSSKYCIPVHMFMQGTCMVKSSYATCASRVIHLHMPLSWRMQVLHCTRRPAKYRSHQLSGSLKICTRDS